MLGFLHQTLSASFLPDQCLSFESVCSMLLTVSSTGAAPHPPTVPCEGLLLGGGQQIAKSCRRGSCRAGVSSLFAAGESLLLSFGKTLPQTPQFEVMLSGFAWSRSVLRAFCCTQCFVGTASWEMLRAFPRVEQQRSFGDELTFMNYK